jgi:hypothetical protein
VRRPPVSVIVTSIRPQEEEVTRQPTKIDF